MDLTREQALKLHREMWGDMQKKLGDNPSSFDRSIYKAKWIRKHGYPSNVKNACFLCEYALKESGYDKYKMCNYCPIDWSELTPDESSKKYGFCTYASPDLFEIFEIWQTAPISQILDLPEREETK